MSVNIRFYTGKGPEKVYHKAWMYERASSKGECVVCEKVSHDTILIRHKEPKKIIGDTRICHQCLVLISKGDIKLGGDPPKAKRKYSKPGRPKKVGSKKGVKPVKFKCKHCDAQLARANVKQHYKFTHPDIDREVLIDNLIEDNTDAPVGRTDTQDKDQEA